MLLTLTLSRPPHADWSAADLGYLLHKHPSKLQSFDLSSGRAHVFYPRCDDDVTTAALLLDIDPIALVRGRDRSAGPTLAEYVNDRPYVASSFLSTAISRVFGTALAGHCRDRPLAVDRPMPFTAELTTVPCRGGERLARDLFEPLGYTLEADRLTLDAAFPEWGPSRYYTLRLRGQTTLRQLLTHLFILIPVLDDDKHYWVGDQEIDKLLAKGQGWLAEHPLRDTITKRYLKHQHRLTREALARLTEDHDVDAADAAQQSRIEAAEKSTGLNEHRLATVVSVLKAAGAKRVLDLGCGEGKLIQRMLKDPEFLQIIGADVSTLALERAEQRLHTERSHIKERVKLIQAGATYRDERFKGLDAAAVVEVIEHLDPQRLRSFERVLFEFAKPGTVVVTTPNAEYNVKWESLPAGDFRHYDHRFEWSRGQFESWGLGVADRNGYTVRFMGIGPPDPDLGAPTQMAVFTAA